MRNWKKIFFILFAPLLSSCYDDYIHDYEYTTIFVPYQVNVRTFVVGEGMRIRFGAELGGVRQNTSTRNVTFKIDPDLISRQTLLDMQGSSYPYIKNDMLLIDTLRQLPASLYKLSHNNTIEILPGNHVGTIEIKADSAAFLADPRTLKPVYAIPFTVTGAEADRLLENKRTGVIAVKYENMLFGDYLHGGVTTVKNAAGSTLRTVTYKTTVTQGANETWKLSTVAPDALTVKGYSNVASAKDEMKLTLDGDRILVSSAPGATYQFMADGESKFNRAKKLEERKIYLNYKFTDKDGSVHHAQDTLTFRRRMRDGVNEWQGYGQ